MCVGGEVVEQDGLFSGVERERVVERVRKETVGNREQWNRLTVDS